MADTQTTNLNLTKPEPGAAEDTWGISLNADLDALDAIFSSTGTQINLNPNQINFADNKKAVFGNSSDLQIYHDSSNSYIRDAGDGDLNLRGDAYVRIQSQSSGTSLAHFRADAEAALYFNNSKKLETTSTGIDVTGVITTDGLTTSADINFGDDDKALFGAGNDLKIYHSANNQSYIHETGTGDLNILATNLKLQDAGGSTKVLVNSTGIDVTGTVVATSDITSSGVITTAAHVKATGGNLKLWAAGNHVINIDSSNLYAQTDNSVDLGFSSSAGRFRNLYLAGTANVGGLTATGDIEQTTGDLKYTGGINWDIAHHGASQNMIFRTTPSGGSATQRIRVSHNGDISFYEDTGSSQALFWDASAEALGIGTTSIRSNYSLDVRNAGNSGVNIQAGDEAADIVLSVGSAGTPDKFVVTSGGKIGIGTNNPSTALEVNNASAGATVATFEGTYSGSGDVKLASFERVGGAVAAAVTYADASTSMEFGTTTSHSLHLTTGDTARLTIDNSGNVLVGTTSDVVADTSGSGFSYQASSGYLALSRDTAFADASVMYLNRTNADGQCLQFRKDGTAVGNISITSSATTYNTSSDARLKDVTGEARGLEVINELNPVAYNWKADGKADEGLIAQEVKELVPNAVSGSEEEMYQMDYSKLVVHLVAGMKEQQTQIESLKGEIANLKGE